MTFIRFLPFAFCVILFHTISATENVILPEGNMILYSGTINNNLPVRMLLERENGNSVNGIYYYGKTKTTIFLQGKIDSTGEYRLTEYTLQQGKLWGGNPIGQSEITGFFEGKLQDNFSFNGNWISADRKKTFPFILKQDSIPSMDLQMIYKNLHFVKSDVEFQFLVCSQLTKTFSDFSFFIFGGGEYDTAKVIGNANCQSRIFTKNLFGNDSTEKMLALNFSTEQTLLFVFHLQNGTWTKIPDCICARSDDSDAHASLTHNSTDTLYFSWHFAELFRKGEYVIESREYGGSCSSSYPRGNDIEYRIIGISENGFRIIYEEVQDYFFYADVRPKPMSNPKLFDFKIVPGEKSEFPRRLKRTEYTYALDEEGVVAEGWAGKTITYVELK